MRHVRREALVLGIDLRTEGVHVVIVDSRGHAVAEAQQALALAANRRLPDGYLEQDPLEWWNVTRTCLKRAISTLRAQGRAPSEIVAGAVDSAMGAVILLGADNQPLRPAVASNDQRAVLEADELNSSKVSTRHKLGYRFDAFFALPKMLWLSRHDSGAWAKAQRVVQAEGYLVGKLTGEFGISDSSHALASGFDVLDCEWPAWIEKEMGIETRLLPRIICTGNAIAPISKACADETGLSETTQIVAGTTDEIAEYIASGAKRLGDWNTRITSRLTFRGLSKQLPSQPAQIHSQLHPTGLWMASCSSNVSAYPSSKHLSRAGQGLLDRAALELSPTSLVVYPLLERGEQFPFERPNAVGFIDGGKGKMDEEYYTAHLEGTAFVECLAYQVLTSSGAGMRERIYTTGNGSRDLARMQIRADVLGVEVAHTANAHAAMGSAVIAAASGLYEDLTEASAQMVRIEQVVTPRAEMVPRYGQAYQRFLLACQRRGYVDRRTNKIWQRKFESP